MDFTRFLITFCLKKLVNHAIDSFGYASQKVKQLLEVSCSVARFRPMSHAVTILLRLNA